MQGCTHCVHMISPMSGLHGQRTVEARPHPRECGCRRPGSAQCAQQSLVRPLVCYQYTHIENVPRCCHSYTRLSARDQIKQGHCAMSAPYRSNPDFREGYNSAGGWYDCAGRTSSWRSAGAAMRGRAGASLAAEPRAGR